MHLARQDGGVAPERLTPARRRQMTRHALVEAAADAFARKGFYGASLEEIAEAAGFTRGAIYSNFGSKEELLYAVLELSMDRQIEAVSEAMEERNRGAIGDAVAASRAWSSAAPTGFNWAALSLELRVTALRNPEVRKRLVEIEQQNRDKVARLIEEESERRGARLRLSPRDFADISNAALDGLNQMAAIHQEEADHYLSLVEKLFVLLAETVVEADNEDEHGDGAPGLQSG